MNDANKRLVVAALGILGTVEAELEQLSEAERARILAASMALAAVALHQSPRETIEANLRTANAVYIARTAAIH